MHVRRESNPQPAVLETAALPIELLTYHLFALFAGGDTAAQLNKLLSCVTQLEYESELKKCYLVSLCGVRFLHQGQYFLYSTLPVCFFLFFVVE